MTSPSAVHLVCGLVPHCSAVPPLSPQLQFVLTIIQTSCGVIWRCAFPLGWLYFQIGYMISLIVLFTNFYIQVSLTLLWQLGFGMLSAKTLTCSFKGVVWSPWCVRCTGLEFSHSDEAAPASGGPVTAGVGGTRSVPHLLSSGSMAGETRDLCAKARLFSVLLDYFPVACSGQGRGDSQSEASQPRCSELHG